LECVRARSVSNPATDCLAVERGAFHPQAIVTFNGENTIRTSGKSQADAWWRACQEAQALGMLKLTFS
jgi:hypothetical protein